MTGPAASLALLGDALDHAEATIPALHRSRSRYRGDKFQFPRHAAITAYRDLAVALAASDVSDPSSNLRELNLEIRAARKDLQELREIFDNRCALRGQPGIDWTAAADGGASVSLRGILDVYADMVAEQNDLKRLVNFRAEAKKRQYAQRVSRHRFHVRW